MSQKQIILSQCCDSSAMETDVSTDNMMLEDKCLSHSTTSIKLLLLYYIARSNGEDPGLRTRNYLYQAAIEKTGTN